MLIIRKIAAIVAAGAMLLALASCSGSADKSGSEPTTVIEVHGDHTHVIAG
ncbi:MAG: hypothetical protein J6A60_04305 [Clostridia bacterium]|nr:hypothetical protein [Clostridia bacterium]